MRVLGAGGVMLTLGACDSMPASAVAGWNGPDQSLTDPRLRALSWALLAPNPHNMQPWLADVRVAGQIMLYTDQARLLPETDPPNRQILIGCGAFLELLQMAAAEQGWNAVIDLMPEGVFSDAAIDARPFARVRFEQSTAVRSDPLFAAVRQRRTTRTNYSEAVPPQAVLTQLASAAARPGVTLQASIQPDKVRRIATIAIEGYTAEFRTQATWEESARLLRFGSDEVAAEPSGLTFVGTKFWIAKKLGMLAPEKLKDASGSGPDDVIDSATKAAQSTQAWIWLTSADNTRVTQIESGRSFMRATLAIAAAGLVIHPNSQVLQEFAAMDKLYKRMHQELGVALPGRVQMLARLGYADSADPAPRRPLSAIIDKRPKAG